MDKPTLKTYHNGVKAWYLNEKLHREDGPAVEYPNGTKEWWQNGNLHREDGPAYESHKGAKAWYYHGKLHREDGPATERPNHEKEWRLHGKQIHLEDILPKLHQPGYQPTKLEQTMIKHHLSKKP